VVHPSAGASRATLVLGHSAGGGIGAPDLVALARTLPRRAVTVALVELPWRVAGRRVASPPPALDRDWLVVLAEAVAARRLVPAGPLVLGGRSAGARVAARTAVAAGAAGVLALAFPLVPPGSGRTRLPELRAVKAAGVSLVVVQGERDPFGAPGDFPPDIEVRAVPWADHSFAVPRSASREEALAQVVAHAAGWLDQMLAQ
jgi:hypothetical protein